MYYHDLRHTTDALLVFSRLLHGAVKSGETFSTQNVLMGKNLLLCTGLRTDISQMPFQGKTCAMLGKMLSRRYYRKLALKPALSHKPTIEHHFILDESEAC